MFNKARSTSINKYSDSGRSSNKHVNWVMVNNDYESIN